MTRTVRSPAGSDARLALSATGILATFNQAGVLDAADVHVAQRTGRLTGETDDQVLLAAALAVRAVRLGSVCVDLATVPQVAPELPWPPVGPWVSAVTGSPLLAQGVLRWEFGLLYLARYWHQEAQLCADLTARMNQPKPTVDQQLLTAGLLRVFPDGYEEQRDIAQRALIEWTTIVIGGPGTGKTTAVAGLLALLSEHAAADGAPPRRIALTAPTGKATARLQEAVATATRRLPPPDQQRLGSLHAVTLHRLLGARRDNGTRFRHHRGNRLPHDVIVVDESSMVSLTMMARLIEAVRPQARLVLVGDPDQLASVEAGAVLADLVSGLQPRDQSPVVRLATVHRFGAEIGSVAQAIRSGAIDTVLELLRSGSDQVEFIETDAPIQLLRGRLVDAAVEIWRHAEAGRATEAVAALDGHRLLCAHRDGPYGIGHWNRQVELWLSEAVGDPLYEPMFVGRPLLVTANDYGLGVFNGDAGVVVASENGPHAVLSTAHGLTTFPPGRLSDVETMFATTIHKSQGSQAQEVTVLLPPPESRLLSRELLYTAVTRAEQKVRVVGTEDSVRAAVELRAVRASGLRQRLVMP